MLKPWSLKATAKPTFPANIEQEVLAQLAQEVAAVYATMGQMPDQAAQAFEPARAVWKDCPTGGMVLLAYIAAWIHESRGGVVRDKPKPSSSKSGGRASEDSSLADALREREDGTDLHNF